MAVALSKEKIQALTGLHLIYSFVTLLVVNVLVVAVANMFFPTRIVLGTSALTFWWAMHHSMVKLTMINVVAMPLVAYYEWKNKTTFTPKQWMITYFVINVAGLWMISRFADNLGLGLSAWWVVLSLAVVLDWAQGTAMMALGKYLK